jgi:hypothetical protein
MRSNLKLLSIIVFQGMSAVLKSQTNDFGVWTAICVQKEIKKWSFEASGGLRTQNNVQQVNRWSLQLDAAYDIMKPLKIGASYEFQYCYDEKYTDFQPRNRFSAFLQGKQKLGNFTFSLRERVQATTKDDGDRVKSSGKIDTYKMNPAWVWRNKMKVVWNIPNFPVNPALSLETFYQLNNPDGNVFYKQRYTLSLEYKISKKHALEAYSLLDRELNISDPVRMFVVGMEYKITF